MYSSCSAIIGGNGMHFNVTASPTAARIWRRVLEATPLGRQPKFLIHDRDVDYGRDFDERLANLGITGVRIPPRAPKANAIGERIVRTIRTECLDHVIVINERHLQAVLAESCRLYNRDRPHRSLEFERPMSGPCNALAEWSRGRSSVVFTMCALGQAETGCILAALQPDAGPHVRWCGRGGSTPSPSRLAIYRLLSKRTSVRAAVHENGEVPIAVPSTASKYSAKPARRTRLRLASRSSSACLASPLLIRPS